MALAEIRALQQVNDWCRQQFPLEDNFITIGDFNAGKRYVNGADLGRIEFRRPPYHWLISDDVDTTLGQEPQAHDRIVIRGPVADSVSAAGVVRAFTDDGVSDHWPVFVEISFGKEPVPTSAKAVRIARALPDPLGADRAEDE